MKRGVTNTDGRIGSSSWKERSKNPDNSPPATPIMGSPTGLDATYQHVGRGNFIDFSLTNVGNMPGDTELN